MSWFGRRLLKSQAGSYLRFVSVEQQHQAQQFAPEQQWCIHSDNRPGAVLYAVSYYLDRYARKGARQDTVMVPGDSSTTRRTSPGSSCSGCARTER
jgi:hypothetical protein